MMIDVPPSWIPVWRAVSEKLAMSIGVIATIAR
jgi:hypothetical protein